LPIGLINLGPTRADDLARVRVAAPAGEVLAALAERLSVRSKRHAETEL
jgi:hypothetical protein